MIVAIFWAWARRFPKSLETGLVSEKKVAVVKCVRILDQLNSYESSYE